MASNTQLSYDKNGNIIDANGNIVSPETNSASSPNASTGGVFSGLASMIGGQLAGPALTNPNYTNAVNTLQGAQNQINSNITPSTAQLQLVVQNYVDQGILTPTQAQSVIQNPSALNNIMTNPNLTKDQYQALGNLQNIANNGGLSPAMQAQLASIQGSNAAQESGANAATMQQAQERGVGNAGTTLLGQLTNNQGAAQNNYQQGLGVAAQGQQNALNALTQGGNLSTTMQTNAYNQAANTAAAQNAINQFNAQNAQNVNLTNAAAQNTAAATNLANKQNVANQSTTAQNTAAAYNATIPQQQFADTTQTNTLNALAAKNTAGAQQNLGNAQTTSAGNATNAISGLLGNPNTTGSLSNTAGSAINNGLNDVSDLFSDKNLKKDIKPEDKFDMDKFLNSVTGYKYNYKPKALNMGMPEGQQHGIMAQDLEKTPVGKNLVENTPEGKMVNYSKSGPIVMSALGNLHDRLKAVEALKKNSKEKK